VFDTSGRADEVTLWTIRRSFVFVSDTGRGRLGHGREGP
jgi:hypothetical protein